MTVNDVEQLVQVLGWTGLCFVAIVALALVGGDAWRWLWRELRGAWRYFVLSFDLRGYGQFADAVPESGNNDAEQRSDAVEQPTEQAGTGVREHVPGLAEQLAALTDDQLLDVLARVPGEDGPRFAESRIGRFVGGRLEDRIAQVRDVRGVVPEPKPGRVLTYHVNGERHEIRQG